MKRIQVSLSEGEYLELSKISKEKRRTVASQAAYIINTNLPSLSHQRREHDTDTPLPSISETLGLAKEKS